MSAAGDIVHAHHAIDYIEIAVTDIDVAKAFYASAFGWSLVDDGPDYAGIQGDGKERAVCDAIPRYEPGVRGDPLLRGPRGQRRGGHRGRREIVEPIYAFPGGRRFHFADPAGNELAVWSDRSTTAA